MTVKYDYDVVLWDTVGGAYTSESMNHASGGSEKEVVQLAEGLAKIGFHVLCLNGTSETYVARGVCWTGTGSYKTPLDTTIRCKTLIIQRYSTIPSHAQVLPDRMVVRATDVYGKYYDHLQALNHFCVSEWQASAFKAAGFCSVRVIPAMLDDDYYKLASTPKVKGRFIYASAAMKGLEDTIKKWVNLRKRFPVEMADCELHVTNPGYGDVSIDWKTAAYRNVKRIEALPPRELAKYMATCEGLFYVCNFAETFCAVAAIANAVGCRVHVLEKHGELSGVQEAANGFITERDDVFDDMFLCGLRGEFASSLELNDLRVSTVLPLWREALHLDVGSRYVSSEEAPNFEKHPLPNWGKVGITPNEHRFITSQGRERSVPVDTTFIIPDPTKKNVGTYAISGRLEIHDIQDIIKMRDEKRNQPTVCLVMLAKNAESTIKRALDSVKDFVDFAIFQFDDAESSSEMRAVIEEVFDGNVCAVLYAFTYRPWVNFSVNRNALLASEKNDFGAHYVLTLDADDEFVGLSTFDKSTLTLDSYSVRIKDGTTEYERLMLWKSDSGYHYKGSAHEYLTSDVSGLTSATLPGVTYNRYGQTMKPNANDEEKKEFLANYREKYLRDVRLFVAELRENPGDTRATYYLAQSLEDASCGTDEDLLRRALHVYAIRAKMNGFVQEKFLAQMKIGKISKGLRLTEEVIVNAFEEAARVLPERAVEAVYEIMLYYNEPSNAGASKEKSVAAHEKFAGRLDFGAPSGFVVDTAIYAWGYRFQLAIAYFYVGRREEAKVIFEDLLTTGPAWMRDVLKSNLEFCKPPVKVDGDLLDDLESSYGSKKEESYELRTGALDLALVPGAASIPGATTKPAPWFTPKTKDA